MDVTTQLELCFHEQKQILANAAGRVGSQQLTELDNQLLVSLLFIAIPTPFLILKCLFISTIYTRTNTHHIHNIKY